MLRRPNLTLSIAIASTLAMPVSVSFGQTGTVADLAAALRQGGYVLVMRHASSPRTAPTRELANPAAQKGKDFQLYSRSRLTRVRSSAQ